MERSSYLTDWEACFRRRKNVAASAVETADAEAMLSTKLSMVIQCTYEAGGHMIKKLTKHGNSYALVIDKPILELLKIEPETPLEITTDGRMLVISPARGSERRAKFQAALHETNRRYGRALKRLAD